jgi:hypothetical protein
MGAQIAKANADGSFTHWVKDDGKYTTYAGPVKVTAPGVCINWGGDISTSTGRAQVLAGASHCG